MTAIDKAMEMLRKDPLPDDAYDQMVTLEAEATEQEAEAFGDLWEAFYAAGGVDPEEAG